MMTVIRPGRNPLLSQNKKSHCEPQIFYEENKELFSLRQAEPVREENLDCLQNDIWALTINVTFEGKYFYNFSNIIYLICKKCTNIKTKNLD